MVKTGLPAHTHRCYELPLQAVHTGIPNFEGKPARKSSSEKPVLPGQTGFCKVKPVLFTVESQSSVCACIAEDIELYRVPMIEQ